MARYADACNLPPSPDIPRQLALLRRYCEAAGRAYAAIENTAPFRFDVGDDAAKVDELIAQLHWLAGMGIETVYGQVVDDHRIVPIEIMGRDVSPAVADLSPRVR